MSVVIIGLANTAWNATRSIFAFRVYLCSVSEYMCVWCTYSFISCGRCIFDFRMSAQGIIYSNCIRLFSFHFILFLLLLLLLVGFTFFLLYVGFLYCCYVVCVCVSFMFLNIFLLPNWTTAIHKVLKKLTSNWFDVSSKHKQHILRCVYSKAAAMQNPIAIAYLFKHRSVYGNVKNLLCHECFWKHLF